MICVLSGGTGHEKSLALRAGEMEKLRQHGADGAAGHDDGALGAKRAAGTDGDG